MSRRELDAYFTPEQATRELLKQVPIRGCVLEPCSGDGAIARVLAEMCLVTTNDLDPKRPAAMHADATDARWWTSFRRPEWVVSNPPFNVAHRILPHALACATAGMAMFLRITYLEPCEGRAGWLAEHPPKRMIVLPRISFTGDGKTDSVTCAWLVWSDVVEPGISIIPDPLDLPGSLLSAAS